MNIKQRQKHTPGEWDAVRDDKKPNNKCIIGRRNFVIATCPDGDDRTENNANARLIAAAPDLLNALEVVVEHWTKQFEANGHMAPKWCRTARDAIEKATGRAVKESLTAAQADDMSPNT